MTTGWFSKHLHVVVVGDSLDGGLALWVKLADVTRGVDLCEVNTIFSNEHTLPHDLLCLLQVDSEVVVGTVNTPQRVVNFDLIKKLPIYYNL